MKRNLIAALALLFVVLVNRGGNAAPCYVQNSQFISESWSQICPMNPNDGTVHDFTKTQRYVIQWPGPYYTGKNPVEVYPSATGRAFSYISGGNQICGSCFPDFVAEINLDRYWAKQVRDVVDIMNCVKSSLRNVYFNPQPPVCACNPGGPPPGGFCPPPQTAVWNEVYCQYECQGGTPIIIDLDNNGYNLTNAANGVRFDLAGTGERVQWSWTSLGSDEAFLALDRSGDGAINNGKELFGNFTDQPVTEEPNGFIALAMFDDNNNRWIDVNDAVYSRLLLWVDSNHDGISQRGELHSLEWGGVERIGLDYMISRRSDQYGNKFRYRAKLEGRDLGRWAWDVILLRGN